MTLNELGFDYLGHCACPGKPVRWVHPKRMEVKVWKSGMWKLLRGSYMVRYGRNFATAPIEIQEYMTANNL